MDNKMNLHTLIENYGFVVHTDQELGFIFSWNGFATVNVFTIMTSGDYFCIDTLTDYHIRDVKEAADVALDSCLSVHNEIIEAA